MRPRDPLLSAQGVSKSFGAIQALNGVSLDVRAGEVHALVGENGAGKSTLIRVMTGEEAPDSGTLHADGRPVPVLTPATAHSMGIRVVHQQPSLFPDLTVAENLALGVERTHPWQRIDRRARRSRARALLMRVGASIDPDRIVGSLTMPEQQLVEIARALGADARVLILDEPTASLTAPEVDALFDALRRLRRDGVGIVYISHRLGEVLAIADRVTILRDGRTVGTRSIDGLSVRDLVAMMVGELRPDHTRRERASGPVALEVRNLSCAAARIRDVSLTVSQGEVLGVAGLVGSGRTQLAETIFGITPADSGEIVVKGKSVDVRSPVEATRAGIAYVPEDRRRHGVIVDMAVTANATLASLELVSRLGLIGRTAEGDATARFIDALQIKAPSPLAPAAALSGGNQQKVAVARWLMTRPDILILDEPTQGVDVRSKGELHALIDKLAGDGLAVVLISSDIHEVLSISDRIAVMRNGAIAGVLQGAEASQHDVLAMALGTDRIPAEPS
jgi:rhamnose transport system ATP-binding protein